MDLKNLTQNLNVLAFDFTKKYMFVLKTDQNIAFLGREAHMSDLLYIMVIYISF
jgi:hypothetical protein